MNPRTVTVTGIGSSAVINPDYRQNPFAVGIGCVVSGTVNYTVEHTFDNFYSGSFNPATATWFPNSGITAKTANQDGNYAFPVQGIRLTIASGTGSVTMTVIQASASP